MMLRYHHLFDLQLFLTSSPSTPQLQMIHVNGMQQIRIKPVREAHFKAEGSVWIDFLCGAFSGGLAAWLTNPIDIVTNRLMLQRFLWNNRADLGIRSPRSEIYYVSTSDCLQKIWSQEGIPGLWRGSSARVLSVVPLSAITFGIYGQVKRWLHLADNNELDDFFS